MVNQIVTVLKLDINNQETWRYQGKILEYETHKIVIEAIFNRDDFDLHGIKLKRNDRFVEYYFNNRWYNIFQIHDLEDDHLKGWYCNICQPADFFKIPAFLMLIWLWIYWYIRMGVNWY